MNLENIMRSILFLLTLILSYAALGQDIPSDSLILKKVFGTTDKNGKTYSYKSDSETNISSYQDSVVFRVVFKSSINIDNKNLIMAILDAPYGTQHGHQFGYRNIYFFESTKRGLDTVNSIKSERIIPIGDISEFEIVDIGKNKKGLISTFQSTGNHHFENTKEITLLGLTNLTPLLSITVEYDNSFCKPTETENDSCEAERYENTFEIIKTNSEWYNIRIHRKDYKFTKGCRENFITAEYDKEYIFIDEKYIEKK